MLSADSKPGDEQKRPGFRLPDVPGWFAAIAAAVAVVLLWWVSRPQLPPRGLLDLTFAGNADSASRVLSSPAWADTGPIRAAILRDYFFIPAYVIAIGSAALWARPKVQTDWVRVLCAAVAGAIAFTGLLDVIENVGLTQMVSGTRGVWPLLTTMVAWPKFFVFAISFLCVASAVASVIKATIQQRSYQKKPSRSAPGSFFLVPQSAPTQEESKFSDIPPWHKDWTPSGKKLGICCSGGGIRSAAYNLGALQALRKHRQLEEAKFVTAVSGGCYIAAAHALVTGESDPDLFQHHPAWELRSPEERHLRDNTSYLAPDFVGKVRFALRVILGLSINVGVLWLALFVLTRPWSWVLGSDPVHPELRLSTLGDLVVPGAMWAAIAWPAAAGVVVAVIGVLGRFSKDVAYKSVIGVSLALLGLAAFELMMLVGLPFLGIGFPRAIQVIGKWFINKRPDAAATTNWVWLAQLVGLGAAGAALGRIALKRAGKISMFIVSLVVPAVVLISTGMLLVIGARRGMNGPFRPSPDDTVSELKAFWAGLVLLVFLYGFSDETTWSMHPFYKRRLFRAFGIKRKNASEIERLKYDDLQLLSTFGKTIDLDDPARYPELIVCAAANISERSVPTGRMAVSFTFGPHEIGGRDIGWIKTEAMEDSLEGVRRKDLTLPAAVAISGAALSPTMGKMTRVGVRPLLAIANVRLGVWLPSPAWMQRFTAGNEGKTKEDPTRLKFRDRPRLSYWLKEIVGLHRKADKFLYVTDGGHFENLGLVELLRRGCTEIYCFDAAGDKINTFSTLGEAIALARTELGVEIEIDPERLEPLPPEKDGDPKEHRSKCDVALGTFTYPNSVTGKIYYAKAAITEAHPWDVKAYGEKDPEFPAHGTASQLYTEVRFEAYRELGYKSAERAIALRGRTDPCHDVLTVHEAADARAGVVVAD